MWNSLHLVQDLLLPYEEQSIDIWKTTGLYRRAHGPAISSDYINFIISGGGVSGAVIQRFSELC